MIAELSIYQLKIVMQLYCREVSEKGVYRLRISVLEFLKHGVDRAVL